MLVGPIAEMVKGATGMSESEVARLHSGLNVQKSSGAMCPKALLPVLVQINAIWEMASEWADSGRETPPNIIFRHVRCLDPGLEDGGIGGVVYRISMENLNP